MDQNNTRESFISRIFYRILGFNELSSALRKLSLKYLFFLIILSGFSLSKAWLSLWYLNFINYYEFGLVYSAGLLVAFLLDFPLGLFADIFGRRLSYILSQLMYCLYFLLLLVVNSFSGFLLLEIISGIGNAFGTGSFDAWYMDTWQEFETEKNQKQKIPKIGGIMSNALFIYSALVVLFIFLSGVALGDTKVIDQEIAFSIFVIQGTFQVFGILFGFFWIKDQKTTQSPEEKAFSDLKGMKKISNRIKSFLNEYFDERMLIFIVVIVLVTVTDSMSFIFNSMLFSPLLNLELGVTLLVLTSMRSTGNLVSMFTTRLSKRVVELFKNPPMLYILSMFFTYPLSWLSIAVILEYDLAIDLKVTLFFFIYLLRIFIMVLLYSAFFNLVYDYTDPQKRASQQSMRGSINSFIMMLAYFSVGTILEQWGFINLFGAFFLISLFTVSFLYLIISRVNRKVINSL